MASARPLLLLAVAAGLAATACGASPSGASGSPATRSSSSARVSSGATSSATVTAAAGSAGAGSASAGAAGGPASARLPRRVRVRLAVPKGEGGSPFNVRRTLTVPRGWTARVWARVPDARMEAETPGAGSLLVSQPDEGRILRLRPDGHGTATVSVLLSGLSSPQGLAFAKRDGHWVLYVGESTRIDRYRWRGGRISGGRKVIAGDLPAGSSTGDDVHIYKDVAVGGGGDVYVGVGSANNANPIDRRMRPERAVIMAVNPDGSHKRIVERGVRNGEGLATAPDGVVWTAVNNRDNIPYPFHRAYGGYKDAFGKVIQSYVNNHPPDEVVPVTKGRDLGWPYCDPDQDRSHPKDSLAHIPFVPDALTNPGGRNLRCSKLTRIQVGLAAHSAPLGMAFLEGTKIPEPWRGGAVIAAHGSWNREPPRAPAILWLPWNSRRRTLGTPHTMIGGFQEANGSRWGRPADAVAGPGGALYVSDDTAGAIYRLQPPAKHATAQS